MFKDDISPGLLPDPVRRRLLRAGAGALALPLLQACGGSGGGDGSTSGPDPTPPPPQPVGTHPPRGLHVSFSDDPYSTRTLTWFTDGSDAPASAVEYGPVEPDMDEAEITGAAFPMRAESSAVAVYDVDALCQSAVAGGISSERPLRYRVGSDEGGWSPTYVLAPTPAADAGFRFCHYGDQSTSEAAQAVTAAVSERAPDFLMIVGDLSYANGEQSVWDTYFDMLEPLAARIPVMTTPGNHEAKDGGGDGYDSRIRQPGQNFYYGFDYGRVHFFCSTAGCLLDGVISAASLATELLAMEADLAQAALRRARGEIDFIVVAQHYTIWTNEDGRNPANLSLVLLEEQILLRYGVDLLLVGHDHIYERSKPMAFGRASDGGYVQVTQGGGGQSLYELLETPADWSAYNTLRHGFTEYLVEGGVIRGTSYAVDRADNSLPGDGSLEAIDSFELTARNAAARAAFAQPARSQAEVLGRDWSAVVQHTLKRNAVHDAEEVQAIGGVAY